MHNVHGHEGCGAAGAHGVFLFGGPGGAQSICGLAPEPSPHACGASPADAAGARSAFHRWVRACGQSAMPAYGAPGAVLPKNPLLRVCFTKAVGACRCCLDLCGWGRCSENLPQALAHFVSRNAAIFAKKYISICYSKQKIKSDKFSASSMVEKSMNGFVLAMGGSELIEKLDDFGQAHVCPCLLWLAALFKRCRTGGCAGAVAGWR